MDARSGPHRARRITRACDRCHQNNNKCSPGPEPSICQTCFEFRSACTYTRPVRRRGPKPLSESIAIGPLPVVTQNRRSSLRRSLPHPAEWVYSPLADPGVIAEAIEAYHTIVYPIFPLCHWPTFIGRVRQRHYMTDQAFYVTIMAVCAIVIARQRTTRDPHTITPSSKSFYHAAVAAFPTNLSHAPGFEFKRAKVLMAIACIQYGAILEHQTHLGEYVVLACNDGFQDEGRWERDLTEIQLQERRRLFWSAYTLEVFSAITWDGVVRFRERQCNVDYPAEVYDEDISEAGWIPRDAANLSFLQGWNFTTDMYRVLEHLVGRLKKREREPDAIAVMFYTPGPSSAEVLHYLDVKFAALPAIYQSTRPMTGDDRQDRFGFQAANIAITLQTVKLALAGTENHSVGRSCEIAGELLDALAAIPTAYIMAISTPMLHHLASCGHLLANVIQSPLSQWALMQVRNVLTAMIDLLSGLERSLSLASDVSVKLRGHVAQIEAYMDQAAKTAQQSQVYHSVVPQPLDLDTTNGHTSPGFHGVPQSNVTTLDPANLSDSLDLWPHDFTFEWPEDHQIELRNDLTESWPFDIGAGLYDFFGEGDGDTPDVDRGMFAP